MEGRLQGANETAIAASPETIFSILDDPGLLPAWFTVVEQVECSSTRDRVGVTRTCVVEVEGRKGETVETCVLHEPHRKIGWVMDRDTLGFGRMLADFGWTFTLEPRSAGQTRVLLEGFYTPRGVLGRAMNAIMLRRKLHGFRNIILANLKEYTERAADTPRRATSAPRSADATR